MRLLVTALTVVLGLLAGFQQSPPTLTFTPFRSSGIYESGERAGWTVTRAAGPKFSARFKAAVPGLRPVDA